MEIETTLTSTAEDGLYEILLHAARASSEATKGAVGMLELKLEAESDAPSLDIEAEFAYQAGRRVIDELAVRVGRHMKADWENDAMLREGLAKFGGTDFTNLDVSSPDGVDTLDASVSFGSFLPLLAENMVLPLEGQTADELKFYSTLLSDLGVSHRVSGSAVRVARRQLRARMTLEQQVASFSRARQNGRIVSLYACVLPATQAVRFSEQPAQAGTERRVDVVLSRGLSGGYVCSSEDARRMQAFVEHHLGIVFSGGVWSVRNIFGQAASRDVEPVFGGRNRQRGPGHRRR